MLRLDGRVAIITGAGRGLGAAYAALLAARGARVVVNDPGVELGGDGGDVRHAQAVVDAILASGGEAIVSYDKVGEDAAAQRIAQLALDSFGRVDILINNAGNFMPVRGFLETDTASFQSVFQTHLLGSMQLIRSVWPHMASQRYGKILNITSNVGYIGTRGRLEYGTAKGALHGFTRCLSHESLEHGIYVNAVSPGALTRPVLASTDNFPEAMAPAFSAALIAPTVLWLVHEDCTVNGEAFTVMGGTTTRIVVAETNGWRSDAPTPEAVQNHFEAILDQAAIDASALNFPQEGEQHGMQIVGRYGTLS